MTVITETSVYPLWIVSKTLQIPSDSSHPRANANVGAYELNNLSRAQHVSIIENLTCEG